jgi:tetratricopeptide (TPR) repeat protein
LEHLNRSLRFNTDNLRARNLKVIVLRLLDREDEAESLLQATLRLDPLDWFAKSLNREKLNCDLQVALDIAHDLARAGFEIPAIVTLTASRGGDGDLPAQNLGAAPLTEYTLGWLWQKFGDRKKALKHFKHAAALPTDYCFPSRLEEIAVFESAMRANPKDPRAPYYLGNLLYDRRRHEEAIRLWEQSARLDPDFSIVWRNLGIGYFNIRRAPAKARAAYDKAFRAAPGDARLLYERDQLWKRLGDSPAKRLRELEKHSALVAQRDDLSVELCALYNQTSQPERALDIVSARKFQPWEGGEGQALGQHVRARLALGRTALAQRDYSTARRQFENALTSPENLGEARHLLANQSDVHYWLGVAFDRLGDQRSAREHWRAAATFRGDFQEMSMRAFSEMTYYSALSWEQLGQKAQAKKLFRELLAHAQQLQKAPATIDYFATSLPTMLLFDDDLPFRQETTAFFLQAQAQLGLGRKHKAQSLLAAVLKRDPSHALAADLAAEIAQSKKT